VVERIRLNIDSQTARERLAGYLERERCVPEGEGDRRAGELLALLGNGGATPGGVGLMASGASALVDNWWLFALRGAVALLFGVMALAMPAAALAAFVLVFGVWAFIDGIHALALAVTGWRSWQMLLVGLVGIALGVFTFWRPGITAFALYAAVAAWAIARGVLEIVVAIELRRQVTGEAWLIIGGVLSILFGVLMVALPAAGALALAWLVGAYALVFGVIMLALAAKLYRLRHPIGEPRQRDVGHPLPA
jgi:uncharacterized membrane protein HdeD (DUF308 family)